MKIIEYIYSIRWRLVKRKRDNYLQSLVNKGLKLGSNVDIIDSFFFDPSHCFLIEIGDETTIAPNVRLIAHDASTKKHLGYTKIGIIKIGKNCFIGDSVIILPGVSIGDNSIIGAGSVVTKDIPAMVVAAGNPAKVMSKITDYLDRIKGKRIQKKIFSEDYFIENIDQEMRDEMIESIGDSIGFIR